MKWYLKLRKSRLLTRGFWLMVLLMLWEGGVRLGAVSPLLLPSLREVFAALLSSFISGDLLAQSLFSLWIILLGMLLGMVLALGLALLSVRFTVARDVVDTLLALAHPLPGIAILPLIIIWFGTGTGAITAIIVHSCLWPMLLNLLSGFDSCNPVYTDAGKNLSMTPTQIALEILVPASCSQLLSGAKIGWARAWRALISAEMVFGAIGAKGGVGWYIFKQRTFMNTPGLFAGIIVVIVIGLLVEELLFSQLEKRTVKKWGMSVSS